MNWKSVKIGWDHTSVDNTHKFTVTNIERTDKQQELSLKWDGSAKGAKQKGSTIINIPSQDEFSILDIVINQGENQRIDIILSDPVDAIQETDGLIWFKPDIETGL